MTHEISSASLVATTLRIQTYCQIEDLSEQLIEAAQEEDRKKAKALERKIAELNKKMGPEFAALVDYFPLARGTLSLNISLWGDQAGANGNDRVIEVATLVTPAAWESS